ncbi:phospholipase, patatin family protein [Aureobasidium subglaciale]|nr:phospholipase, patatin family protein [Aureobasidium subglaciale]KAI5270692.1 phospholipase, patatin family protein [Aureobasidium subglaciale]
MPGKNLNLLSLDGGGVRGLSTLYILKRLMAAIDLHNPPKPCDYFDMIGGTSTGGLIAIMLGRLEMSVDECIEAYIQLSEDVFHPKRRIPFGIKGNVKERYDSEALESAVKKVLRDRNMNEEALLQNEFGTKRLRFVCCTSKETSETSLLRSWNTIRGDEELYDTVRIWEAARATSAASTYFDPISIGEPRQYFLDGGTGANNPVNHLWGEATDLLPRGQHLSENLGCLVSIGTGQPGFKPVEESILGVANTLLNIATETETTANLFHRDKSDLFDKRFCFRFNVPRGLGDIGLAEAAQLGDIKSMTRSHLQTEAVQSEIRRCVERLGERQPVQPAQATSSALQIIDRVDQDEGQSYYEMSQDSCWQLANHVEADPQSLINLISNYQSDRVHYKLKVQKTEGTTQWLTKHISAWLDHRFRKQVGKSNCLWISGTGENKAFQASTSINEFTVGCGKTFLANTAIECLVKRSKGPVVHFYFDPDKHDMLTTEGLLRSYVKQLLRHIHRMEKRPPLPVTAAIKRMFGTSICNIDCTELVNLVLKPILHEIGLTFFVVDGLDLCPTEEYKRALSLLSSLLEDPRITVIVSGRDELEVDRRIVGSSRLEVPRTGHHDDVAKFVTEYIRKKTAEDGPISDKPETIERIRRALIDQAKEM